MKYTPEILRERAHYYRERDSHGDVGLAEEFDAAADGWEADRHALVVAGDTAMELSKRLEAAERYVRHKSTCRIYLGGWECDCGFWRDFPEAALTASGHRAAEEEK